jgi:hypothetical protein
MYRHIRQNCKIATSAEGMDKLMEYTLASQNKTLAADMADMKTQMAELAALMKTQLLALPPGSAAESKSEAQATAVAPAAKPVPAAASAAPVPAIAQQIAHATQVNNVTNINIQAWHNPEDRIVIPVAMLRAAFTENRRLAEYCGMSDEDKTDPKGATPYVLEALMELVKRAHADPAARNVYLNPKRADQVLVYDEETWKVVALTDAIRDIFDSVAGRISKIILSSSQRDELPQEVQASASWIPVLYEEKPEEYVEKARKPMAAHLANTAPASLR